MCVSNKRKDIDIMEKQIATKLLQVFGYVNAKEEDVIPLESTGAGYCLTYICVRFCNKTFQFRLEEYSDCKQWEMMEVENA